jgi:hypothetical protein
MLALFRIHGDFAHRPGRDASSLQVLDKGHRKRMTRWNRERDVEVGGWKGEELASA